MAMPIHQVSKYLEGYVDALEATREASAAAWLADITSNIQCACSQTDMYHIGSKVISIIILSALN